MLKIKDVSYKYNKNLKLDNLSDINLEAKRGECVLFCGRSGSGKTTVSKLINSLIPNYYENGELSGEIIVDGVNTKDSQIYEVSRVVSSVFQNPKTQFFNINTTSELLFYLENRGVKREVMKKKLEEVSELFGIDYLLNRDIFELSGGEKQIIAVAAAYASSTDIILLDEPSSNLDEKNTKLIGEILKKIKEKGKTIIIFEHRFYYIKEIIDRVYYLDDGKVKGLYSKVDFFSISDEKRKELGLRAIEFENLKKEDCEDKISASELLIEKINHRFKGQKRALNIIDKRFDFGSIVGIYGHNGVGKSTFIRILMGLEKSINTKISIDSKVYSSRKRLNISYLLMQDVNHQLFTDSVKTEVSLGKDKNIKNEEVDEVLKTLNIYDLKDKHPMSLSGGQKQRVAIASALLSGAKIICFDEPTSGMDYDNMMRISKLIKERVKNDTIFFVISHDHEFLNNTADTIFDIAECSVDL